MKKNIIIVITIIAISLLGAVLMQSLKKTIAQSECDRKTLLSKPPKVDNLQGQSYWINDTIKVELTWSSPDIIGGLSGNNPCLQAKNGLASKLDDRPFSDLGYIVEREGRTIAVLESSYKEVIINSGARFSETFSVESLFNNLNNSSNNNPNIVDIKQYTVYTFNKDGRVSDPIDVSVTIKLPDPD